MNLEKLYQDMQGMPTEYLQRVAQDKQNPAALPATMAMAWQMDMRKGAEGQRMPQNTTPIRDQLIAQANGLQRAQQQGQQGLQQLQQGMARQAMPTSQQTPQAVGQRREEMGLGALATRRPPKGFANGGIVAFAGGGTVTEEDIRQAQREWQRTNDPAAKAGLDQVLQAYWEQKGLGMYPRQPTQAAAPDIQTARRANDAPGILDAIKRFWSETQPAGPQAALDDLPSPPPSRGRVPQGIASLPAAPQEDAYGGAYGRRGSSSMSRGMGMSPPAPAAVAPQGPEVPATPPLPILTQEQWLAQQQKLRRLAMGDDPLSEQRRISDQEQAANRAYIEKQRPDGLTILQGIMAGNGRLGSGGMAFLNREKQVERMQYEQQRNELAAQKLFAAADVAAKAGDMERANKLFADAQTLQNAAYTNYVSNKTASGTANADRTARAQEGALDRASREKTAQMDRNAQLEMAGLRVGAGGTGKQEKDRLEAIIKSADAALKAHGEFTTELTPQEVANYKMQREMATRRMMELSGLGGLSVMPGVGGQAGWSAKIK